MTRILACALAGAILCSAFPCSASFISLNIKVGTQFKGGKSTASVSISNLGDESAHSIEASAVLPGYPPGPVSLREALNPNDEWTSSFPLGQAPVPAGTYSVWVFVRYRDVNGYPYATIRHVPLVTADPGTNAPPVVITISGTEMTSNGNVPVEVTSCSSVSITGTLSVVLPPVLSPDISRLPVSLSPGESVKLNVPATNVDGRAGHVLPVLASFDYIDGGEHKSPSAASTITIVDHWFNSLPWRQSAWWISAILLLAAVFIRIFTPRALPAASSPSRANGQLNMILPSFTLLVLTSFLLYHLPPNLILLDTMATGGDTPAHNYLVSHLRESLLGSGRIVSWAAGWWCGFPMFQSYFSLPYILAVILDIFLPFNIAFKLASISGIMLMAPAAWWAARRWGPGPIACMVAAMTMVFLFDNSNTMWGGNIYSTLAGMISNSLSFPFLILFLSAASRDADDGLFRLSTVGLLVLVIASHFFTTVIAIAVASGLPFFAPRSGIRRALKVVVAECAAGLLLMSWWILPLVANMPYTAEFGGNWTDWPARVSSTVLPVIIGLSPFAVCGLILGWKHMRAPTCMMAWMLLVSALLLVFGHSVSHVFINIRLWPYMMFAFVVLAGIGAGLLIHRICLPAFTTTAGLLLLVLSLCTWGSDLARHFAVWNYEGMENKPRWPVVRDLILPLRGTPGRLANDLHAENNGMGSTRAFEAVPHIAGKPVIEGGLVSSSWSSLFPYYIQSESSETSAGAPVRVRLASFNITNATRHLELFNVKHFIAKSPRTRTAMIAHPSWQPVRQRDGWTLFELTSNDGSYVTIPSVPPRAVACDDFQQTALDWFYVPEALDHPFVLLKRDGRDADEWRGDRRRHTGRDFSVLDTNQFAEALRKISTLTARPCADTGTPSRVLSEAITDGRIVFSTTATGMPHIIKSTYFPQWKVRGASRVYMCTPCFMLVYPDSEQVELYYGTTGVEYAGIALTVAGACLAALVAWHQRRQPAKQA